MVFTCLTGMNFYNFICKSAPIPFLFTKNDLLFDFIKKNLLKKYIFVLFKEKFCNFIRT